MTNAHKDNDVDIKLSIDPPEFTTRPKLQALSNTKLQANLIIP